MKKTGIILLIVIALIVGFLTTINWLMSDDEYKDKVEYPLKKLGINDKDKYLLIRHTYTSDGEKFEVITDNDLLKKNKNVVKIKNKGSLYATTPEGLLSLYKNGYEIDSVPFDPQLTYEANYGTLSDAFKQINELTMLKMLDAELIESDNNYTVIKSTKTQYPSFYTFIHGDNKEDLESTKRVDVNSQPMKIQYLNENIIEFKYSISSSHDSYRYYNTTSRVLSQGFNNVRAYKNNLIVFVDGGKLIVRDIFDSKKFNKEFKRDFSQKVLAFNELISAEFIDNNKIKVKYFSGENNEQKEEIINIGS